MENRNEYLFGKSLKAYAELYAEDNNTAVTIPDGDFVQYLIPNSQVGEVKRVLLNETTQEAEVVKSGVYQIVCVYSSESDTSNILLDTALFVNGVKSPGAHIQRELKGSTITSSASIAKILKLNKGDKVSLRVKHSNSSSIDITTHFASFSMHLI